MKKLFSALLAAALALSLAAPALAYEDTDPPLWQLCLASPRISGEEISLERCLAYTAMTEEEYAAMAEWCARFQKEHAGEWAAFDPDAYYLKRSQRPELPPVTEVTGEDKAAYGGEQGFADYMRFLWIRSLYQAYDKNRAALEMVEQYPEDYAAFDADAWFPGIIAIAPGGHTKASYMEAAGFTTEEEFRLSMFGDWAAYSSTQPHGITVTVDGQLVRGWTDVNAAYPYAERGRILVSTPALEEPLGYTVERDEENRVLTCIKGDLSVSFTDGGYAYTVTRAGASQTLALDVPPKSLGPGAPFYVPLRALVEALGCTVTWNGPFRTAAIATAEK